MDQWLLSTKKVKLTVSTCDIYDKEETKLCANEAGTSSMVPMEHLSENDDGHFPMYWTEDQWHDKLNTYNMSG
jgi:hypothetical protein